MWESKFRYAGEKFVEENEKHSMPRGRAWNSVPDIH